MCNSNCARQRYARERVIHAGCTIHRSLDLVFRGLHRIRAFLRRGEVRGFANGILDHSHHYHRDNGLFALRSPPAGEVLMTATGWFQIALFLVLILAVTKPLGLFMARVFNREKTFMDPVLRPIERLLYRLTGVDEAHEMRWTEYAIAMRMFSAVSMILLYAIQRLQGFLLWNPQKFGAVSPAHVAFNTAASFTPFNSS